MLKKIGNLLFLCQLGFSNVFYKGMSLKVAKALNEAIKDVI